jgi:hypothetical protein
MQYNEIEPNIGESQTGFRPKMGISNLAKSGLWQIYTAQQYNFTFVSLIMKNNLTMSSIQKL